ncbi:MAG: hypothetical protein H0W53_09280 [Acidobacteria bacterium]|nr:hypothetical protein [Acidobacteriota bacterium]
MGRTRSANSAKPSASNASVLASWPVAFAKSRTCRGFATTIGRPRRRQRPLVPPVASRTMTYMFDGKQYIAVAAGSTILAFRLNQP